VAIFNLLLIVFCAIFGLFFHILLLVALRACRDRGAYETSGASASGWRRSTSRSAVGLYPRGSEFEAGATVNRLVNPLPPMLSTTANPTDGLRFDGDADGVTAGVAHPEVISRRQAAEWSW
jgi:hypothetical protein